MPRDYSLLGPDAARAEAQGLVTENWYRTEIPRETMKALMQRSDHPALRDTVVLLGLMVAFAGTAIALMPSWWAVPFWLAYGVLYGSAMDARWHECGHGTAFRTRWMNQWVYQLASFCLIRDPYCWKYSHARHHSDTIIVGRDPEVALMRPVKVAKMAANVVGLIDAWDGVRRMWVHARGRYLPDEAVYVAPLHLPKTVRTARIWLAIYAATVSAALLFQSWVPVLLIGLPRLFGAWHMAMTGWLQHGGLADNVLDHRLNCRTVYMNPVSRFLYLNMNYHIEHHMFPLVPYHRLPALHAACAHDFPAPNRSIFEAYAEMLPVLWRQRHDPEHYLRRPLPETAQPYLEESAALDAEAAAPAAQTGWVDACATGDLPPEDVIRFDHGARTFVIVRDDADRFYCSDGLCTHEDVHLCDGLVVGATLECPKHSSIFDCATGAPQSPPAGEALKTYPVKIENGRVLIAI